VDSEYGYGVCGIERYGSLSGLVRYGEENRSSRDEGSKNKMKMAKQRARE